MKVLARRPAPTGNSRLDWRVIDFENLADQAEQFDVDVVFSCLGSTKKNAGSPEAFKKIDFGYVLTAAHLASKIGTQAFLVVSSAGANRRSPFLYMRTKGELEAALEDVPIPRLHIFRPNLLLGDRIEMRRTERLGIAVMSMLTPALAGPLRRYRAIKAATVAKAMVAASLDNNEGTMVHTSLEMETRFA